VLFEVHAIIIYVISTKDLTLINLTDEQIYNDLIEILSAILYKQKEEISMDDSLTYELHMTDKQIEDMQLLIDIKYDSKIGKGVWSAVDTVEDAVNTIKDFAG
jgi:hypothetical protein